MRTPLKTAWLSGGFSLLIGASSAIAQDADTSRPNILVTMPDDVGMYNVSAYSRGAMGYRTPNIDGLAEEGAIFTDMYAQPSCTAGGAAFITGMYPIRSGLTTVGMVGARQGMLAETPTRAEVLKQQGYATGQFGKNHLGDRNEHLPTVHGFDEFFGFLYHLNVLQEPLDNDYPPATGSEKDSCRGVSFIRLPQISMMKACQTSVLGKSENEPSKIPACRRTKTSKRWMPLSMKRPSISWSAPLKPKTRSLFG